MTSTELYILFSRYHLLVKLDRSRVIAEVKRKLFHSLMLIVVLVNWLGGPLLSIGFTAICLLVFLAFDYIRIRVYGYSPLRRVTETVLRPHERTMLGANVYFAIGTLATFLFLYLLGGLFLQHLGLLCRWLLTGWLAVMAVVVAAIGDGTAALIGLLCGCHHLKGGRTVEGTIGGFIGGFLASLPLSLLLGIPWFFGAVAAVMLMAVDVVNPPLNDNLVNPLATGFSLTIMEVSLVAFGVI